MDVWIAVAVKSLLLVLTVAWCTWHAEKLYRARRKWMRIAWIVVTCTPAGLDVLCMVLFVCACNIKVFAYITTRTYCYSGF